MSIKKQVIQVLDASKYEVTLEGFHDFDEFQEALNVIWNEIKVDRIQVSGLDAMDGYFEKDGITVMLKFNNWDAIMMIYHNAEKSDNIALINNWCEIIFMRLISKFPDEYNN